MSKRLSFFLALIFCVLLSLSSLAQDTTDTPETTPTEEVTQLAATEVTPATPTAIEEATEVATEAVPSVTAVPTDITPEVIVVTLLPEPTLVPVVSEPFHSTDLSRWSVGAGWELVAQDQGYAFRSSNEATPVISNQGLWSNVAVELQIQSIGSDFELFLRQTVDNSYRLYLPPSGKVEVYRGTTLLAEATVNPQNPNSWRHVRFSIMGDIIRVAIDGVEVLVFQDVAPYLAVGQVAFQSSFPKHSDNSGQQNSSVLVDNIRIWIPESEVTSPTPLPTITPIPTLEATPTDLPTITPIPTLEATFTLIPTITLIPTETATLTPTPSETPTATATEIAEVTEEPVDAQQPTAMPDMEEDEIIIIPPVDNGFTFEPLTLLSGCDYEVDPLIGASDISAKITDANDDGVPVTICIPEGTYTFTTGSFASNGNNAMPVITGQITLLGLDNGAIIQRSTAGGTPNFRFLMVAFDKSLTLNNLTFQNGATSGTSLAGYGGAVHNIGTLTIIDTTFTDNYANVEGGAIYNNGTLNITAGTFNSNEVGGSNGDDGGAIDNHATATISDSSFHSNIAKDDGGAIWSGEHANLTVHNSTFTDNYAGVYGGGILNFGYMTITDSVFGSQTYPNTADEGGAIYNDALNTGNPLVTITGGSISFNIATLGDGGGIKTHSSLTINSVDIVGNISADTGGAVYAWSTSLTITNDSLIANNSSTSQGGGVYVGGSNNNTTITNSTFDNNSSSANGGAIYNVGGYVTLSNATIENNDAVLRGGGVYNGATLTVNQNTVFAANGASDDGGAIYSNATLKVTDAVFKFNTATDQGGAVRTSTSGATNYVNTSCIFGNTAGNTSGIYSSASNFNATNNWWGAANGPSGSGSGSGDAVNGNVSYSGYTTTSACTLPGAYEPPEVVAISANAVYTEGDDPVLVLSAISITDIDSTQMSWATVTIDNYATLSEAEHDRLSVIESGGITATYNNLTGVLELSNAADIADYIAVLETLTFATVSQNPDEATRTLEIAVNDGSNTTTASVTVGVVAINDIPFIHLKTANAIYVEDGAAVTVLESIELSDAEGTAVEKVTITISNLLDGANEVLDVSLGSTPIQKDYTGGVLTLDGLADAADYATVLATLTYENEAQNLHTDNRILNFEFTFADTPATVINETLAVQVRAIADAPEVDLDVINVNSADFVTDFAQGLGWTTIVGTDVAITDIDSLNLSRVIITLTNHPDGASEQLRVDTLSTGIISQYSNYVLTLFGDYPLATYATVVETLQYNNTAGEPTIGARTITIVADDGAAQSNAVTSTVTVESDNSAPIVSLDADNSGGASPNYSQTIFYAESLAGVTITDDVDITDYDDTNLESATITMTEEDIDFETLAVDISANPSLIVSYQSGTLSIQGTATVAEYEAVLATLTYHNAAPVLTGTSRVVSVIVSDGDAPSEAVFATVQLEPEPKPTEYCTNWHITQGDWVDSTGQGLIDWHVVHGMYGSSGTYTARVSADLAESGKTWLVYITSSDTTYSLYNVTVGGDVLIAPQTSDQIDDDPLTYSNSYVVAGDSIALEWAVDTYTTETETLRFMSICYAEISRVDLEVSTFDTSAIVIDPDTLVISGEFNVNILNDGTAAVTQTFNVVFFEDLNDNDTYEAGVDRLLGQAQQAGLAAGQTVTVTANATGEVEFVGNLVHVWVDSSEIVHEIDETNNIFWAVCIPEAE
jgi:predicted outer membrane repeat protein